MTQPTDADRRKAKMLAISAQNLSSCHGEATIAQGLAAVREEAEAQTHYHCGKRIADLERQVASLTDERDKLREFICHLNNRARHDWAQAVDEATDALFKQMSANPILEAAKRPHTPTDATDRKPTPETPDELERQRRLASTKPRVLP